MTTAPKTIRMALRLHKTTLRNGGALGSTTHGNANKLAGAGRPALPQLSPILVRRHGASRRDWDAVPNLRLAHTRPHQIGVHARPAHLYVRAAQPRYADVRRHNRRPARPPLAAILQPTHRRRPNRHIRHPHAISTHINLAPLRHSLPARRHPGHQYARANGNRPRPSWQRRHPKRHLAQYGGVQHRPHHRPIIRRLDN